MMAAFTFPKALLRWVIVVAVAWLFMFLTPGQWFVNWYLPMSFFLLMGTVTFGVIGLGWPLAVPGGSWKPGRNRWLTGIGMCIIWIAAALVLTAIETWIWPKMPLSGAPTPEGVAGNFGSLFGIGVFSATLWYAFIGIECRPFGPAKSWANWLLSSVVILLLAGLFWIFALNLNNTSGVEAVFNPHGKFLGGDWFALCVWILVFVQMFGGPMVFQGWPWYKLPKSIFPLVNTIWVIVLGYVFWKWVMPGLFPKSTTFTWAAIGASVIGWSLMSSIAFEFYPFAKMKQPMRGVGMFIVWQVIVPALWILLLRYAIGPAILTHLNNAFGGPAFDINLITAWFTLHVTAVVLLIHNFFFMRAPFSIPGPPLGPEELPPAPAPAK
jgi:hypothetical protein